MRVATVACPLVESGAETLKKPSALADIPETPETPSKCPETPSAGVSGVFEVFGVIDVFRVKSISMCAGGFLSVWPRRSKTPCWS
jgi:hypothetical protein